LIGGCLSFIYCPIIFAQTPVISTLAPATIKEAPSSLSKEQQELRSFLKEGLNKEHSFSDKFDAEVWLFSMSQPLSRFIKDPKEQFELLSAIHQAATAAELHPDIVLAVIEVESGFDRFALSSAGAQGLMQVMPFWKKELGRTDDNLMDTLTNLRYGCRILQFYLKKENGNLGLALARYNGSYGRTVYIEKVMDRWRSHWYPRRI
jgi:soluble lytic murein transglycosylase-like protein